MKENKTENLLWIIFTIIGGIFVVIGLIIVGNVFNYENKESTVGIITEISTYRGNNDDRNYRVYVSYNVDGRTYESELNGYSSSFYEGKKINIYYDKNNPNKIGMKSLDFIFLMFPGFGLIFLSIGGTGLLLKNRNKKFFESDGFSDGFLPGRGPSLYFVRKLLLKMKKYGDYNKTIVKQAIKMVIVIVENTRYITES